MIPNAYYPRHNLGKKVKLISEAARDGLEEGVVTAITLTAKGIFCQVVWNKHGRKTIEREENLL